MANKGLQFEHAVMYSATSKIINKNADNQKDYEDAAGRINSIPNDIRSTADRIVESMAPQGNNVEARQKYYQSFQKMSGGGEEPKTDIMFKSGGTTYRCSMKWGKSYQLTSAGIDKSVQVFQKVLAKTAKQCGGGQADTQTLGYLQLILERINNKCENAKGTVDQPTAKKVLSDIKKSGGLNEQLQEVLGSKSKPDGAKAYDCFKYNLTHECMTGAMLFNNDDRAATHLLTEGGVKPIDEKAVRDVMKVAGVRMSLKGRGKDKVTGVRQNAIVIRYEV